MAVTIYNVAETMGISSATVSRALNDHPRVNVDTKKKVQDVARKMGYRQCVQGRFLRTGKTYTIGAIVPDLTNPYYVELVREIETLCQQKGYKLFIMEYMQETFRERMMLEQMLQRQCDAVVTTITMLDPVKDLIQEYRDSHVPCIVLGLPADAADAWIDGTNMDMEHAIECAVSHLVKLGHRNISFIASFRPEFKGIERIGGIRNAFNQFDLPFDEQKVVLRRFSGNYFQDGFCATNEIITKHPDVSAIICHNDLVATGAMKKLYKAGLRVPEDMSVIGIDNTWLSEAWPISITSIDQQVKENARAVTTILFDRLACEEWDQPYQIRIHPKLIERESTGRIKLRANSNMEFQLQESLS
jgi:LacI family transcriptional regulator